MRAQGNAANDTPRFLRGRNRGKTLDAIRRAQERGASTVVRERVAHVVEELRPGGMFDDPARSNMIQTGRAIARWQQIVETRDRRGEVVLAGDVRYFALHPLPVRTDNETLALALAQAPNRDIDRTR